MNPICIKCEHDHGNFVPCQTKLTNGDICGCKSPILSNRPYDGYAVSEKPMSRTQELKEKGKCGFMILTPTPEHNGGMWCAENVPCRWHNYKKEPSATVTSTDNMACPHTTKHTEIESTYLTNDKGQIKHTYSIVTYCADCGEELKRVDIKSK